MVSPPLPCGHSLPPERNPIIHGKDRRSIFLLSGRGVAAMSAPRHRSRRENTGACVPIHIDALTPRDSDTVDHLPMGATAPLLSYLPSSLPPLLHLQRRREPSTPPFPPPHVKPRSAAAPLVGCHITQGGGGGVDGLAYDGGETTRERERERGGGHRSVAIEPRAHAT